MLSPISAGPRPASLHGEPAGTHAASQSGELQQCQRRGRHQPPATAAARQARSQTARGGLEALTGARGAAADTSGLPQSGRTAAAAPEQQRLDFARRTGAAFTAGTASPRLASPSVGVRGRRARRHHSRRGRVRLGSRPCPPTGRSSPPARPPELLIPLRRGVRPSGCCRRPHGGLRSGAPADSACPSPRGEAEPRPGSCQSSSNSTRGKDSPTNRQFVRISFARCIHGLWRTTLIWRQPPSFRPPRPGERERGG